MTTTAGAPLEAEPAAPAGHRVLARNAAIAGGAVVVNGLLSAAILALCAASGQTAEIAAYTVVTSALAFVSVIAGGGSALLYVNGTDEQRALVRSQWMLVVVPSLVVGTVAAGEFYGRRGYGALPLAASGVIVVGNSLAQLQLGDFNRRMRFAAAAVLMCGSKAASLVLVVLGMRLTGALAVAGLVQLAVGEAVLGRDGSLRHIRARRLSPRQAFSAYGAGRHLSGYAIGELYVARLPTLVLSLVASPAVMGSFGAVVTAYQAIGGVVQSALQVPMIARARNRLGLDHASAGGAGQAGHSGLFPIAVALVCAVPPAAGVAVLAPWLTGTLLHLPDRQAAAWLLLFMLALPFLAVTRALMLDRIGAGRYRWATGAIGLLAAVLSVAVALGVPRFGALGAAGATAAAEALTLAVILAVARPGLRNR